MQQVKLAILLIPKLSLSKFQCFELLIIGICLSGQQNGEIYYKCVQITNLGKRNNETSEIIKNVY